MDVLGRAGLLLLLLELCLVWARSELPASFSPPLICLSSLSIRSHLPPSLLIICLPPFTLLHHYTIFVNCRSSSSVLITLCQLFVVTFRMASVATKRLRPICLFSLNSLSLHSPSAIFTILNHSQLCFHPTQRERELIITELKAKHCDKCPLSLKTPSNPTLELENTIHIRISKCTL